MQNNGFVYVASLRRGYYRAAKNSALSLLDYWPEAKITLFTHPEWVEPGDEEIFENIITDGVPYHKRAKLWALDKTLYDLTVQMMLMFCLLQIAHTMQLSQSYQIQKR